MFTNKKQLSIGQKLVTRSYLFVVTRHNRAKILYVSYQKQHFSTLPDVTFKIIDVGVSRGYTDHHQGRGIP